MTDQSEPARKIHPNSVLRGPLSNKPVIRKAAPRKTTQTSRVVAPYPCPLCGQSMHATEIIDFGSVQTPAGKVPSKHHRSCKEKLNAAAEKRPTDKRSATGPDLPA